MFDPGTAEDIAGKVEGWTTSLTLPGVCNMLGRLEGIGLVTSRKSRRTPGDELRRWYQITEQGTGALFRAKAEGKELADAAEGAVNKEAPENLR
jgi:hypothetical protein